jgi:hypothetical protein
VNPNPFGTRPQSAAAANQLPPFWAALHRRTCDRIAVPWARGWLLAYAHLEPGEVHGWPSLVLVLESDPPGDAWTLDLLQRHYRDALAEGCKGRGPLAALPLTLEVAQ